MAEKELLKLLRRCEEDGKWVSEVWDELKEKYEGKVFAVKNKRVLEVADTVEELLNKLEEKGEESAFLLIEAVPPKDASFTLEVARDSVFR